jgi:tripartite ATP-independent transporter DctM subunit
MPGGLAITTVFGNAAFGAVTGASLAGLVTFTPIAYKPMLKLGYDKRLAAASLMASGTLSQLIPPSLAFILYSAVTNESVGRLFIAGVFPGVLQALMYFLLVLLLTVTGMFAGPAGPGSTWKEKIVSLKGTWGMLLIFLLVIGGIYLGIFTPTEGAAVGLFGTFIIFLTRQGFNKKLIVSSFREGLSTTAMIFFIIVGSMIFARFISASGMTTWIAEIITGMGLNQYLVLALAMGVFLLAGCVMPATPMVLLFTPLFYPIFVTQYGMDGIWFGVIIVVMVELALITPPVGLHLFAFQNIVRDDSLTTVQLWQGILPWVITDIIRLVIMVAFPMISLWLPMQMYN